MTPLRSVTEHGTETWTVGDQFHREDGPAVITRTGQKYWYQHGKLHRDGAPAVDRTDGTGEYYIRGVWVASKER